MNIFFNNDLIIFVFIYLTQSWTLEPLAQGHIVLLWYDLRWSRYIGSIVTNARSKLSWVFSLFKTRDRTVMTTLYMPL